MVTAKGEPATEPEYSRASNWTGVSAPPPTWGLSSGHLLCLVALFQGPWTSASLAIDCELTAAKGRATGLEQALLKSVTFGEERCI